jgi:hypothetical protein
MKLEGPPRPTRYRVRAGAFAYEVTIGAELDATGRYAGRRFALARDGRDVGRGPLRRTEAEALRDAVAVIQDAHPSAVIGSPEPVLERRGA